MSKMNKFSVKTFYEVRAVGDPSSDKEDCHKDGFLALERIVFVYAQSIDEAIELAEKEAKSFSLLTYQNIYGQEVRVKYGDSYDIFEISGDGRELFSTIRDYEFSYTDEEVEVDVNGHYIDREIEKQIERKVGLSKLEVKKKAFPKQFAVKTIYKYEAKGVPKRNLSDYLDEAFAVKERVVLIDAENLEEAITLGSKEAESYGQESWENYFGQDVSLRYLSICDIFEIPEKIKGNTLVYHSYRIYSEIVEDGEVESEIMGWYVDEKTKMKISKKVFSKEWILASRI